GLLAWFAPAAQELTVRVEFADALVLAELRDVIVAVIVLHGVTDVAQLTGRGAHLAADGFQQLAFRGVNAQTAVVRIADEQVAVAVDAQAAGPAVAEV